MNYFKLIIATQVKIKGMNNAALSELIDQGPYSDMSAKYPMAKTYKGIFTYRPNTKCSVIRISDGQIAIIPSNELSKV